MENRPAWAAFLLLAATLVLHLVIGFRVLPGDLTEPDPPAHYVTGVMVYDWLHGGMPLPAMRFAKCYYVQYPRVALGHWPPGMYVAEALWFSIFRPTVFWARCLCAAITWGLAASIIVRCRRYIELKHAVTAAALFLACPLIQDQAWSVMSDLLTAWFVFLSVFAFADYLLSGRNADVIRFSIWTTCAILTKPTAALLLGVIALVPFLTGYAKTYVRRSFWLSILAILAASAPFFVAVHSLHLGYSINEPLWSVVRRGMQAAGFVWLVSVLAAVLAGLFWWTRRRANSSVAMNTTQVAWIAAAVWILTQATFLVVFPLTGEWNRYFVPSIAIGAVLVALGLQRIRFGTLISAVLIAVGVARFGAWKLTADASFTAAMRSIPLTSPGPRILLQSDASGVGAMIAARLEADPARASYMIRGEKLLASQTWSGYGYTLLYHDSKIVNKMLDDLDLDYIVTDSAISTPDALLLREALSESSSKMTEIARIPVSAGAVTRDLVVRRVDRVHPNRGRLALAVPLGLGTGSEKISCE